jgi:hypothetical protein
MRTRTGVGLVAAFTIGMAFVPMSANAACTQTIYADRAYSDGTMAHVLGRVQSADNFAYSADTTNALFAEIIFASVAHRNRLYITGNAGSCPTTGDVRDMGTILEIYQQP